MKHIIYTEEEGGDYLVVQVPQDQVEKLYKEARQKGFLFYSIGNRIIKLRPSYLELVETVKEPVVKKPKNEEA